MSCELWVEGTAENGSQIFIDFLAINSWSSNNPDPVLTQTSRTHPSGCVFYTSPLLPGFEATGWHSIPIFYKKNCENPLDPNQKYDCINGGCLPAKSYNTPGKFANLANCQSACAKDSNCTGECIPLEEIAALQQAASNIRSRLCK